MRKSINCPRCGEVFEDRSSEIAAETTCPMCGELIAKLPPDQSVDPHADFNFVVRDDIQQKIREQELKGKTLVPMIALCVLSGITGVSGLRQCLLAFQGQLPIDDTPYPEFDGHAGIAIVAAVFGLTAVYGVIFLGAICLHLRRYYPLAFVGCLLACVPCLSPCVIVGIPFGILGLILLCNRDLKDTFQ